MSENYRALTRKYRPQSFEDIVSQEHVSSTLLNAIKQNRLSHAYMFCGPRGVGKTTMARVLARIINGIDSAVDSEALNQTLNVMEMDAASNNKVEDVHHLREIVRIPPQNGRYKVFIVDEVHMLSKAAFNALLKTLEEPPEHAIFIFATTEPHKVLPTILSRVQRFDFKRIAVEEIVSRLKKIAQDETITIDEESLHVIAKKADGALRDALGLMDQAIAFCGSNISHNELLQALNVVGTERLFQFMNCVKDHDSNTGLELINTLLQEGYDIQEFLIGLTEHLRNLYIAHHSPQLFLVEASEDTKNKYKETAPDFSRDDLMRMLHIVSEAQIKLKDANQPRIQFEITLLKLIHMERSENLSRLLSEIDALKKNSSNLEPSSAAPKTNGVTKSEAEPAHKIDPVTIEEKKPQPTPQASNPVIEETKPETIPSSNGSETRFEGVKEPTVEMVNEPAPTPVHSEYDIGQPALFTEVTQKAKVLHLPTENGKAEAAPIVVEQPKEAPSKKLFIEDVKAIWPDFLQSLTDTVPKILELQVQRVELTTLKGSELMLACDNPLAKKMVDEQALELSKKLKEHLGVLLRFRTEIRNVVGTQEKAKNPYERFKEIQQKDPIIRDLVERFGAELEY